MSIEDVEDFCDYCGKLARSAEPCYADPKHVCACPSGATWEGRALPADETPDAIIKWWVVDNLSGGEGDEVWIRGWQAMLAYVADHLDGHLENFDEDELAEGTKLNIKLRTGTKAEYDEAANDT